MQSGSEILLNLENYKNFEDSELIGGLFEFTRRVKDLDGIDWNEHPIVSRCLKNLRKRQGHLNSKHIAQIQKILQGLKVIDKDFWQENANNVLRMLHLYKSQEMAQFLDLFDQDILDMMGDPLLINKVDNIFFEKVTGILPPHVKLMKNHQVIRTLEVCVKRNLGSQRLFEHYLLDMIEKNLMQYDV
jgi:hypothetical protein